MFCPLTMSFGITKTLIKVIVCKYLRQFLSRNFGDATLPTCLNIEYKGGGGELA